PWERAVKWARRRPTAAGLIGVSVAGLVCLFCLLFILWRDAAEKVATVQRVEELEQRERDAEERTHLTEERELATTAKLAKQEQALEQGQNELESLKKNASRIQYAKDMQFAQSVWENGRVAPMLKLLRLYQPGSAG